MCTKAEKWKKNERKKNNKEITSDDYTTRVRCRPAAAAARRIQRMCVLQNRCMYRASKMQRRRVTTTTTMTMNTHTESPRTAAAAVAACKRLKLYTTRHRYTRWYRRNAFYLLFFFLRFFSFFFFFSGPFSFALKFTILQLIFSVCECVPERARARLYVRVRMRVRMYEYYAAAADFVGKNCIDSNCARTIDRARFLLLFTSATELTLANHNRTDFVFDSIYFCMTNDASDVTRCSMRWWFYYDDAPAATVGQKCRRQKSWKIF